MKDHIIKGAHNGKEMLGYLCSRDHVGQSYHKPVAYDLSPPPSASWASWRVFTGGLKKRDQCRSDWTVWNRKFVSRAAKSNFGGACLGRFECEHAVPQHGSSPDRAVKPKFGFRVLVILTQNGCIVGKEGTTEKSGTLTAETSEFNPFFAAPEGAWLLSLLPFSSKPRSAPTSFAST